MKLLRQSLWWLITLVSLGSATIVPLEAIQSFPQLSTLQTYINASSNFTTLLSSANNFTFLAPSNEAFALFASQNKDITNNDLIEATLQYSLLVGGFPTLSWSNAPQFVPTNLDNATYSNVTGGQRVELVLGSDGTPQVVTSNKTISTSTSTDIICTGGIIHIINEVVAVPISAVFEITAAGLDYFVSILNLGGYLSTANTYAGDVVALPDVTYFIPNSAAALANATQLFANASAAQQQAFFEYHFIPGFVAYSSLLTNGMQLKTATGSNVTVTIQGGETYINAAKIIVFDYIVANGVFHVLDNILNENDTSPPPLPASPTVTASTLSNVPTSTSPSTSNPTSTAISSTSTTFTHLSSSKSLSTGATAGIGVGSTIAGLLILVALAWFLWSRKQKRDSMAWGQNMEGVPNDMGKYYVQRGTVQRQEDLNLGLESTGMQDTQNVAEDGNSKDTGSYGSSTSRPLVPPRAPSRLASGNGA